GSPYLLHAIEGQYLSAYLGGEGLLLGEGNGGVVQHRVHARQRLIVPASLRPFGGGAHFLNLAVEAAHFHSQLRVAVGEATEGNLVTHAREKDLLAGGDTLCHVVNALACAAHHVGDGPTVAGVLEPLRLRGRGHL